MTITGLYREAFLELISTLLSRVGHLVVAMWTLGFKPKHLTSIFILPSINLLVSNVEFIKVDVRDVLVSE